MSNVCKLISDKQTISSISNDALNTFRDQQKFKVFNITKYFYDEGNKILLNFISFTD